MPAPSTKRTGFFSAYGGWSALLKSRFFWGAGGLTVLAFPMWRSPGWWETVLGVCPDLLGFALGAFALTMGIGSERFRSRLGGSKDGKPSPFMKVAGTFTYFIFMQCLALGYASLSKAYYIEIPAWLLDVAPWTSALPDYRSVGWFIGVWLFAYALLLTIAAGKAMFTFARWFDTFVTQDDEKPPDDGNCRCRSPCHEQGDQADVATVEASETALPAATPPASENDGRGLLARWLRW